MPIHVPTDTRRESTPETNATQLIAEDGETTTQVCAASREPLGRKGLANKSHYSIWVSNARPSAYSLFGGSSLWPHPCPRRASGPIRRLGPILQSGTITLPPSATYSDLPTSPPRAPPDISAPRTRTARRSSKAPAAPRAPISISIRSRSSPAALAPSRA